MPNRIAMKYVGKLFERFPILPVLIFTGFGAAVAYGFWSSWNDYQFLQGQPKTTSLFDLGPIETGKKAWVTLTGLEWKCPDTLQIEQSRVFPLHDAVTGSLVVIQPSKEDQCGSGNLTGVLTLMTNRYRDYLKGRNWPLLAAYPPENSFVLCTSCTAEDAKLGLYFTGGSFLLCLAIILLYYKKMKKRAAAG